MKRHLRVFLALWLGLMAVIPLANLVQRGPLAVVQQVMAARSLGSLREALFNLDQVAALWARVVWPLGISTDPAQVIIGRDGWLYLGDRYKATLSTARAGLTPADARQAQAISEAALQWEAWLQGQGVRAYRVMIGPNKDTVYPQGLPAWVAPRAPTGRSALAEGAAQSVYVDLGDALRRLSQVETEPLYYRTDTHWNALGAAHALRLLGDRLRAVDPSLRWPTDDGIALAQVRPRNGGDLSRFLRLSAQLADREPVLALPSLAIDTRLSDFDSGESIRDGGNDVVDFPKRTVLVSSPQALNPRRVLWVRDSFGVALSPLMAATFSEVVELHWHEAFADGGQRLAAIVRRWSPEFVIVTVVEREALNDAFRAPPPR